MLWNDTIKREIPADWTVSSVSSIVKFDSGYPFSSESYTLCGKYKLLTIKNVQDEGVNTNVDNYLQELPANIPEYCILKKNDILMSLTGNVGRVGILYEDNCLLNQRVALMKPKHENIYSFVYLLLKSNLLRKHYETLANGSSQQNLSPIEAGNVIIPFNLSIAEQFSCQCGKLLDKVVANLEENQNLINLRNWLLPMLMNGQATISD